MGSDYFFYLMGLPEKERNAQIIMLIAIWICMICVGILAEYIKRLYPKRKKSNLIPKVCCKKYKIWYIKIEKWEMENN